jgi:DNA-binding NarL/FixJ family response regulator
MAPSTTTIKIAAIDSSPIRFQGYEALLSAHPGYELVAVTMDELHRQEKIDVGLVHVSSVQGISEVMRELTARRPNLRLLLTTCQMESGFCLCALMHRAKGCLDEAYSAQHLARAIQAIHGGLIWAPRLALSEFVEQASSYLRQPRPAVSEPITLRERQVLELLVTGRSNKEIAAPLGIEERTVKTHVSALMRKVGVHNRVMLSKHALSNSLFFSEA